MRILEQILSSLSVVAAIHEDPRGGPVRTIINGRHRKPTGRYVSRKVNRSLPWEDRTERKMFWLCEADASVVSYLCQPHCLEMRLQDGGMLQFYPDLRRDMADGTIRINEIKSTASAWKLEDPDYSRKLDMAREVYEGLGWQFDTLLQEEIDTPPVRLDTAWAIQRHRNAALAASDRFALLEALERGAGTIPFGVARDALGGGVVGEAKLFACVVRRIASLPLDRRLTLDTPVSIAPAGPDTPAPRARSAAWR